jgi:hypothetical protein
MRYWELAGVVIAAETAPDGAHELEPARGAVLHGAQARGLVLDPAAIVAARDRKSVV